MSEKIRIIKETIEFLKLNIDIERLFKDAENDSDIENLITLWYNIRNDPGLSQMILREIKINYGMAE